MCHGHWVIHPSITIFRSKRVGVFIPIVWPVAGNSKVIEKKWKSKIVSILVMCFCYVPLIWLTNSQFLIHGVEDEMRLVLFLTIRGFLSLSGNGPDRTIAEVRF